MLGVVGVLGQPVTHFSAHTGQIVEPRFGEIVLLGGIRGDLVELFGDDVARGIG